MHMRYQAKLDGHPYRCSQPVSTMMRASRKSGRLSSKQVTPSPAASISAAAAAVAG